MVLRLDTIMLGSADPSRLADFYTNVLGAPRSDWTDEAEGWFGFEAGDASLLVGPHSDVQGTSREPARVMFTFTTRDVRHEFERIRDLGAEVVAEPHEPGGGMLLCTFADPDGNYFQLATPWNPGSP
jgi:predicted enzyme related to lactoylglutathione lyase